MKTTIFVMLVLLMAVPMAAAEMYEWVDESGVVNVTDNPAHIPEKYRNRAKQLEITVPEQPAKALEAPSKSVPSRTGKIRGNDEPLYRGQPLAWWKSEYDNRKLALENMHNELEKLKEEQNAARRKKMIYQRGSDKRNLSLITQQVVEQEERIKRAEQSLAEFESNGDKAGLPVDWRK